MRQRAPRRNRPKPETKSGSHKQSPGPTPVQPSVARILVEYDDGSSDIIELLQRGDFPLYGLTRKHPALAQPRGAYAAGDIAALVFKTALTTSRTEYSLADKELGGLLSH